MARLSWAPLPTPEVCSGWKSPGCFLPCLRCFLRRAFIVFAPPGGRDRNIATCCFTSSWPASSAGFRPARLPAPIARANGARGLNMQLKPTIPPQKDGLPGRGSGWLRPRPRPWVPRASIPLPGVSGPPCTGAACGPCASTPGWATRKSPIAATNFSGTGQRRPFGGVRPAHPDRLRLRLSLGGGRGGQGRSGHRFDRRYGTALCRYPAGRGFDLHDHQCHGDHSSRPVCRGGAAFRAVSWASSRARCRMTSSRNILRAAPTSIRCEHGLRLVTDLFAWSGQAFAEHGIPFPSPGTTCGRRARPRYRKWPSPWPTGAPTLRRCASAGTRYRAGRGAILVLFCRA